MLYLDQFRFPFSCIWRLLIISFLKLLWIYKIFFDNFFFFFKSRLCKCNVIIILKCIVISEYSSCACILDSGSCYELLLHQLGVGSWDPNGQFMKWSIPIIPAHPPKSHITTCYISLVSPGSSIYPPIYIGLNPHCFIYLYRFQK